MKCVILSLLITTICNGNVFESLNWENTNLFNQISKDFVLSNNEIEFRTYNGTNNNILNPLYGSSLSSVSRCLPPVYTDGFNSLSGQNRPNERVISNAISDQIPENDPKFINSRHLTQFAWQWGQFVDHDTTLISEDKSMLDLDDDIDIEVPVNDPYIDDTFIEAFRTLSFGTGTDLNNIRLQFNEITAFIDASMIYGADTLRALTLRTLTDGKLKETEDGLLPKNVEGLPNEPNREDKFFLGGDVRVNEQSGLLIMHTLWVRTHNILSELVADSIHAQGICGRNDDCFDETVYQYTKLIITAIVQKITYKDWMPTLFGATAMERFLGEYSGYNNTVNPGICLIFASAAYRLGHTFVPFGFPLRNEECEPFDFEDMANNCPFCDDGFIELKNAFFIPEIIENNAKFEDALLHGFFCTLANEVDVFITGALRNFLFFSAIDASGKMIFGDLDLVAMNLIRGRDHALPDYNSVRVGQGLSARNNFSDITSNAEIAAIFKKVYGDIDDVDLFLAALAEDHFSDGSFGETTSSIVLQQFGKLRDGDRFYYENYIGSGPLLDFINSVTLMDIIQLAADIQFENVGKNIFQNTAAVSIFDDIDFDGNEFSNEVGSESSDSNDNAQAVVGDEIKEDYNINLGNTTYQLVVDLSHGVLYNVWGIVALIVLINLMLFCFYWKRKK